MAHSVSGWTRGAQVKLWDLLRIRAIPERLEVCSRKGTECHCAVHILFTAFRAHHSCTHQPSLAAHPRAHLLQIGSFNISSHSWYWTELFPVLLHSRRRHAVTTTTAFIRLWSLARTDHSSIHSWQSHIHSFRRRGVERPAGSRHSCRHSRSSDSALRHFCSRAHILTLSVNLTNYVFFLHLRGSSNN